MNYILFDDKAWQNLLPLTFTKPVSEIRIGILTITEKWKWFLNSDLSFETQAYLSQKYPFVLSDDMLFINSKICPSSSLVKKIQDLSINNGLKKNGTLVAYRSNGQSCLNEKEALN